MRFNRHFVIFFLLIVPVAALSSLRPDDLPENSRWYFHADFQEMRGSDAGQPLYAWMQEEIFEEIQEEVGIDLDKEADFLTAFATENDGLIIVIEGNISQDTEDKLVAVGAASGSLDRLGAGSKSFYHIKDDDDVDFEGDNVQIDIDSFDNGAYFSFAVKNKIIITSGNDMMQQLLDNKGKVEGVRGEKGQMFILSAERSLMQAGARTTDFEHVVWDSNILRNTEHAALLIADQAGKIALEAELVTREAEMAESLASIVRGLISLRTLSDDMDPELAGLLRATKVEVNDTKLTINVELDPEAAVAVID